jgi:rhodanese-related sulfurtransferase
MGDRLKFFRVCLIVIFLFGAILYSQVNFLEARAFLFSNFKSIDTEETIKKPDSGVPIIDTRREDEWKKYGVIPNSHLITFFDKDGNYNLSIWIQRLKNIIKSKNSTFILVCAHANRTKLVGRMLEQYYGYKNVYDLKGGIIYGWIKQGEKVNSYSK